MVIKQTLVGVLLTAGIALTGCGDRAVNDSRYDFEGKLDNEYVKFTRSPSFFLINGTAMDKNILKVIREDGKMVIYVDNNNDLDVDHLWVRGNSQFTDFGEQILDKESLIEAQEQYTTYLAKILEHKKGVFKRDKNKKKK